MKRWFVLAGVAVAFATFAGTARSADPPVKVNGGGQAIVTDESDEPYAASFAINGVIDPNGGAHGSVNFVFGSDFGAVWGVFPEETDAIHVWGRVTDALVAEDGTVTLLGVVTEVDFGHGGGKIFEVAGDPFTAVITPGSTSFDFTWCLLPWFGVEVTDGNLNVN